jgi:hypothetical protein
MNNELHNPQDHSLNRHRIRVEICELAARRAHLRMIRDFTPPGVYELAVRRNVGQPPARWTRDLPGFGEAFLPEVGAAPEAAELIELELLMSPPTAADEDAESDDQMPDLIPVIPNVSESESDASADESESFQDSSTTATTPRTPSVTPTTSAIDERDPAESDAADADAISVCSGWASVPGAAIFGVDESAEPESLLVDAFGFGPLRHPIMRMQPAVVPILSPGAGVGLAGGGTLALPVSAALQPSQQLRPTETGLMRDVIETWHEWSRFCGLYRRNTFCLTPGNHAQDDMESTNSIIVRQQGAPSTGLSLLDVRIGLRQMHGTGSGPSSDGRDGH